MMAMVTLNTEPRPRNMVVTDLHIMVPCYSYPSRIAFDISGPFYKQCHIMLIFFLLATFTFYKTVDVVVATAAA
jgi:hypothetical protein